MTERRLTGEKMERLRELISNGGWPSAPDDVKFLAISNAVHDLDAANAEIAKLGNALRRIVEHVHPGRPRDWHWYPTRLRDEGVCALKEAGIPFAYYDECERRTAQQLREGGA